MAPMGREKRRRERKKEGEGEGEGEKVTRRERKPRVLKKRKKDGTHRSGTMRRESETVVSTSLSLESIQQAPKCVSI